MHTNQAPRTGYNNVNEKHTKNMLTQPTFLLLKRVRARTVHITFNNNAKYIYYYILWWLITAREQLNPHHTKNHARANCVVKYIYIYRTKQCAAFFSIYTMILFVWFANEQRVCFGKFAKQKKREENKKQRRRRREGESAVAAITRYIWIYYNITIICCCKHEYMEDLIQLDSPILKRECIKQNKNHKLTGIHSTTKYTTIHKQSLYTTYGMSGGQCWTVFFSKTKEETNTPNLEALNLWNLQYVDWTITNPTT